MQTFLIALAVWIYFNVWFFAAARFLHMKDDGSIEDLPKFFRYSVMAGLYPGLALDFLFNLTYGTLHFREWPREWLFSARVTRHSKRALSRGISLADRRGKLALWWRDILNLIDPGHID